MANSMPHPVKGTVYLVGAGPGAPDLITLRGAEILRRADIVFHDALVHPDTLEIAAHAEKVAVGKRCGRHSTAQHFINKRLADAARSHRMGYHGTSSDDADVRGEWGFKRLRLRVDKLAHVADHSIDLSEVRMPI